MRVGDVRLFFDVEGPGLAVDGPAMQRRPTLVLLPGGPGFDHTVFKPAFSQLADVAQVVYVDLRGHGRSDQGDAARWTVDVWAEDIRQFCDVLGIERPVVLGWSFGGMVAMAYAARYPDHPAGLVLQSAFARLDIDRNVENFQRLGGDQAAEAASRFWSGGGPDALADYGRLCGPLYGPGEVGPNEVARMSPNLELLSNPGSVMRGVDLLPELPSVRCPALVVAGEVDPVAGVDTAAEIVAALPSHRVRFERFAGAGHHIHQDCPDRFFALLRNFLAEPPRTDAGPAGTGTAPSRTNITLTPLSDASGQETDVHRQDAAAFVEKVFGHLNQRDYQQAARYFADDVTLTGAEPAVLAGRDAVIRHFRHSDAALADSMLAVADVLAGETKVGVQLILTGTHTGSFDMGPGRGAVPATGKHAAIPVFWVMTVENGLITSIIHYWDMFRLLTELGLSPGPGG